MDQLTAEMITRATREDSEQQANADLDLLRRQAVEAARARSRAVFKISLIDSDSGAISYNPAGRLLRDWYLHVYINGLRANIGRRSEAIDDDAADQAASLLGQLRPDGRSRDALLAVHAAEQTASADAARSALRIMQRLRGVSAVRGIHYAPDERFDGDLLHVHVIRHWYQHCYDAVVDEALRARNPISGDVEAEDHAVASVLVSGEIRRLVVGRDGMVLVAGDTAGDQLSTRVDHRLAQAWNEMDKVDRVRWLSASGAAPHGTDVDWPELDGKQRSLLIRHYLDTRLTDSQRPGLAAQPIDAPAIEAARQMFDHPRQLVFSSQSDSPGVEELDLGQIWRQMPDVRTRGLSPTHEAHARHA